MGGFTSFTIKATNTNRESICMRRGAAKMTSLECHVIHCLRHLCSGKCLLISRRASDITVTPQKFCSVKP